MTTNSSDLLLAVTTAEKGVGKASAAHTFRNESTTKVQQFILDLSSNISGRATLLEASSIHLSQDSEDLVALAWIRRTLEDVEATLIGLLQTKRRDFAAVPDSARSSAVRLDICGPTKQGFHLDLGPYCPCRDGSSNAEGVCSQPSTRV